MNYDGIMSSRIQQVQPSGIRKFFDILEEMKDAISLGVGEPDFVTPWHIRDAGIYSLEKGFTKYTSNAGMAELRREIASYLERRFQLRYDFASQIIVTVGGSEAIDLALRCLINPGDEVIIPTPAFGLYEALVQLQGGVPVSLPTEHNHFQIVPEELKAAITDRTKAIILTSPNNPTGCVYTKETLDAVHAILRDKPIFVLCDDVYRTLTYCEDYHSFAEYQDMRDRIIVVQSFSKPYAMTGWRIGYVAGPRVEICAMTSFQSHATSNANSIAQYAAMKALQGDPQCVTDMVAQFEARRNAMVEKINSIPGLSCMKPQGAFYIMLNITGVMGKTYNGRNIDSSQTFAELLLADKHVAVVPGNAFEAEGFCRLSYAVAMESCMEGLRRIEEFVSELK